MIPIVSKSPSLHGPSDRIRTCGILLPKQARYQLRYTRLFSFCLAGRILPNVAHYQLRHTPIGILIVII